MNDKNFIEELKRKRDEYGVTQIRLKTYILYEISTKKYEPKEFTVHYGAF